MKHLIFMATLILTVPLVGCGAYESKGSGANGSTNPTTISGGVPGGGSTSTKSTCSDTWSKMIQAYSGITSITWKLETNTDYIGANMKIEQLSDRIETITDVSEDRIVSTVQVVDVQVNTYINGSLLSSTTSSGQPSETVIERDVFMQVCEQGEGYIEDLSGGTATIDVESSQSTEVVLDTDAGSFASTYNINIGSNEIIDVSNSSGSPLLSNYQVDSWTSMELDTYGVVLRQISDSANSTFRTVFESNIESIQ